MASIPGEIADALVALLKSDGVQTALVAAIASGELPIEAAATAFVDGLKANGVVGMVLNAVKGSIDTEIKALFASLPPATIAAYITALAEKEAIALGG